MMIRGAPTRIGLTARGGMVGVGLSIDKATIW
jgi:hypothetical protein